MKLLFKTRKTGNIKNNTIKIGKTTISFKGKEGKRLFSLNEENFVALGLDENENLCIYFSPKKQPNGFLKVYKPFKGKDYWSISINGENKKVIADYYGEYEISEITVISQDLQIRKAVLRKIG